MRGVRFDALDLVTTPTDGVATEAGDFNQALYVAVLGS